MYTDLVYTPPTSFRIGISSPDVRTLAEGCLSACQESTSGHAMPTYLKGHMGIRSERLRET
jgi:hypothetical protein